MPVERRAELLPPAAGVANMFALVIDSIYVGVFPVPSNGRVDAIPLVPADQVASFAQVRGSELREVVDFPGWSLLCVTRR